MAVSPPLRKLSCHAKKIGLVNLLKTGIKGLRHYEFGQYQGECYDVKLGVNKFYVVKDTHISFCAPRLTCWSLTKLIKPALRTL